VKLAKDVEQWLAALGEPPQQAMRRVVEIVLGADERMGVEVKYGTLAFAGGGGDCCSFVQWKKKTPISLMFNRGAIIEGDFPHMEGDGPTARFMRFADLAEVNARAKELGKIAAAWCERMAAAPKAKPPGKPPARPKKKR
jgi:uncharacterized protein DUF1801